MATSGSMEHEMTYVFVLGRNPALSRAELAHFCEEVFYDPKQNLLIGQELKFENPRNLPKTKEQIFLDRLGGTIRMAEVIDEYFDETQLMRAMITRLKEHANGKTLLLGISGFGIKAKQVNHWLFGIEDYFRTQEDQKIRLANPRGQILTSGKIFHDKLIKKGVELIVWRHKNSYLLAQTRANQNLRNYELRDRQKHFRDPKMGMLPPKIAQILINLANPDWGEVVIDPFCGSGTVNIEAAITGFPTKGSDLNPNYLRHARENFEQMADKFRYDRTTGEFKHSDVLNIDWQNESGVIVTEGWLGKNFTKKPHQNVIEDNAHQVMDLWKQIFTKLKDSKIRKVAFCLPAWNLGQRKISISQKLAAFARDNGYTQQKIFQGKPTTYYERDGAYVAREICVMEKI